MDAAAYLSLLSKAKLVFESKDTYLSFPVLSPLTYQADDLRLKSRAGESGAEAADRLRHLAEFSEVVNRIQSGVVAAVDAPDHLWDIYDDVLTNAELCDSQLTAKQEKEYAEAVALLHTTAANGLHTDSPELARYRQYRDAWIKATEGYKAQQVTAECSTDPAVKAAWDKAEPGERARVEEAEEQWASVGRRADIEAAQQVERATNAKAPSLRWEEWRSEFNADLDVLHDADDGSAYAPTTFTPSDVFDHDDWLSFTLSADEVVSLVDQAPLELKTVFSKVDTISSIESVTFEYRSVALDRPWLERSVFESRFWRLGPDGGELSDGGDPPTGSCPSYPVAIVFARRIKVTLKETSQPDPVGPGRLLLRPDLVQRLQLPTVARPRITVRHRINLAHRVPAASTMIRASGVPDTVAPEPAVVGLDRVPAVPLVRRFRLPGAARITSVAEPAVAVAEPVAEPDPAPDPAPDPEKDVQILGFICKRLPRCPDPDPKLNWT